MINNKVLYSLDDLMIEPNSVSFIKHRSDVKTHYEDGMLPIFTAPMPCVVDKNTYTKYLDAGINPIIPRTETIEDRLNFCKNTTMFVAFSLEEFKLEFIDKHVKTDIPIRVLIDIANGNLYELHYLIQLAKRVYKDNIIIMSGNIASPSAFLQLANSGCDYIRCSVGTGTGCCTATYTGVYYPMGSLIDECYKIKRENCLKTNIIADGGITEYRNAFKALALGANYVMMGSRLAQCVDSPAESLWGDTKIYYGMASEHGSKLLGKDTSAPEGMKKLLPTSKDDTIANFSNKFSKYLSSTMSYCNCENLIEFIGKQKLNIISNNASKQFNN